MSAAVERIIAALSARDCHPTPSGEGWLARCPAHDDRKPSLSVSEGDGGRALLKCHAGCSHGQVVRALGLEVRDLFDDAVQRALATVGKGGKSHAKTFPTWQEAIPRPLGAPSLHWEYEDASGKLVGIAARWDSPDGSKTFRPLCLTADGWRAKAMAEPRPLYRLPAILTAGDAIVVVEGEKCVDALGGVGIVATTSSMGAEAAHKSDWSPLAGRQVVILPDNDAAGVKYASEVARLAQVAGAESVSLACLANYWPACPAGGDIADWIEARGDAAEPVTIRDEIEKILATARPVEGINEGPADALASQSLPPGAANLGQLATLTDAGLCKRLCHEGQGRFLWVSERKTWVRWDDRRWVDDPDGGEPRRVSKAIAAALWK